MQDQNEHHNCHSKAQELLHVPCKIKARTTDFIKNYYNHVRPKQAPQLSCTSNYKKYHNYHAGSKQVRQLSCKSKGLAITVRKSKQVPHLSLHAKVQQLLQLPRKVQASTTVIMQKKKHSSLNMQNQNKYHGYHTNAKKMLKLWCKIKMSTTFIMLHPTKYLSCHTKVKEVLHLFCKIKKYCNCHAEFKQVGQLSCKAKRIATIIIQNKSTYPIMLIAVNLPLTNYQKSLNQHGSTQIHHDLSPIQLDHRSTVPISRRDAPKVPHGRRAQPQRAVRRNAPAAVVGSAGLPAQRRAAEVHRHGAQQWWALRDTTGTKGLPNG